MMRFLARPSILGGLLCAISVVGIWLPHLNQSLWLDELQTAWVVQGNIGEAISRAFHTQGFTPFYYVLLWFLPFGASEAALRVPSILLSLGAAALVYLVARRVLSRSSAWVATIVFITMDETVDSALNARPYALAQFFALLSTYVFMRWAQDGKRLYGLLYALSVVLTVYAHFLYGGIILVHACYWLLHRKSFAVRLPRILIVLSYIPIGLVPVIPQVSSMLEKRQAMAIAAMPQWYDLFLAAIPWIAVITLAIAYFLASAVGARIRLTVPAEEPRETGPLSRSRTFWFFLLWAVLPSTALIIGSWVLGSSLFVPRYFAWAVPGVALVIGVFFERLGAPSVRILLPVIFVIFSVVADATKPRMVEDWRSATAEVRKLQTGNSAPALLYSGVVESSRAEWLLDPMKQGQFASPILYYPIQDPWYLLPFSFETEESRRYWDKSIVPNLPAQGPVVAIVLDNLSWTDQGGKRVSILEELERRIAEQHFALLSKQAFGRVWVMSFDRQVIETLSGEPGKS